MKTYPVSPRVAAARDAMLEALRVHAPDMDPIDLVAVMAQTLGQMVALLDQRQFTPQLAMQVVEENLLAGNAAMVESKLGKTRGSA